MNLVQGSCQFLLYRCPCLKNYCNHWYHWQPQEGPRRFVSPGNIKTPWRGQSCQCHQLNCIYCELTQNLWSAERRAGIFHWQHSLGRQVFTGPAAGCLVAVDDELGPAVFLGSSHWLPWGGRYTVFCIPHTSELQKIVLDSHVGLFMRVCECMF